MGWDVATDILGTPSSVLTTRLKQAIWVLGAMHVNVNPSGRHYKALELLREYSRGRPFDPEIEAATRTASDAVVIVSAAYGCRRRDTPFSPDKLKQMMGDPLIDEGQGSSGRDVQFELLLASMFHHGGAEVRAGEPDLQITYRGESCGVAAKRIRSLKSAQLRKHVSKAVRQIARSGLRGWIALNLNKRFESVRSFDDEVLLRVVSQEFDTVRREVGDERWDREAVLGLILHGQATQWTPSTGSEAQRHTTAWLQRWMPLTDEITTERTARDFMNSLYGAMEAKLREIWREDYAWRM